MARLDITPWNVYEKIWLNFADYVCYTHNITAAEFLRFLECADKELTMYSGQLVVNDVDHEALDIAAIDFDTDAGKTMFVLRWR